MIRPVVATIAALLATAAGANTWIDNVKGVQVAADGSLERFDGLMVGDDGKVIALTRTTDEARRRFKQRIDGGGRMLLPGLIDGHGHVMLLGFAALQLDLVGTTSLEDLEQRLRSYASRTGPAWITGRGWNQELWPDKRFPTAADLDSVVRERPVVLERVDGHAVVANSAALKAANITSATPDPTGGKIERDADGNPTGLLIDAAAELVEKVVPAPSPLRRSEALAKAQEILLSNGLTAVADMGTSRADWELMNLAGSRGQLRMRVMAYSFGLDNLPDKPSPWLHGDRLQMGGIKLYGDGALGSRGAWLKQPYADKPDTRGLQFLTDAQLREQADTAAKRGFQLAIHAIGDAANAQVLSAYEELSKKYGRDGRWRIEHFQIADPRDIARLAPTGIIASMQPTHQTSDRTMAEARLGPARLPGAYAWQSVLKSGARLAFGSDFPVESPNPFPGLAAAISREDMNGQPPGGWAPTEKLSFAQALNGFTRGAAYAGFADTKIGSLEPGKWADFILVDRDIATVDAKALARTQVLETWVAGKKVWSRPASAVSPERGR